MILLSTTVLGTQVPFRGRAFTVLLIHATSNPHFMPLSRLGGAHLPIFVLVGERHTRRVLPPKWRDILSLTETSGAGPAKASKVRRAPMISEMALERATRPAVLGRGQVIAWREGRIWSRRIAYDGSLTRLSVHVDSSSGRGLLPDAHHH